MTFERRHGRFGVKHGDSAVELLQLLVDRAQLRQQRFERLELVRRHNTPPWATSIRGLISIEPPRLHNLH